MFFTVLDTMLLKFTKESNRTINVKKTLVSGIFANVQSFKTWYDFVHISCIFKFLEFQQD